MCIRDRSKLVIAKADGGETTVISNTDIAASNYEDTSGKSEYAQNMYISGDTLVTVSYTHLDVYKRQVLTAALPPL